MEATSRTPLVPIREVFRLAAEGASGDRKRSEAVAEALGYLQRGFDAHYAAEVAGDEQILLGDGSYAWAIDTIARLDEPEFVAVASRLIRDGAGRISAGGVVGFGHWMPHLTGLLDILTGEGREASGERILEAAESLEPHDGPGRTAVT